MKDIFITSTLKSEWNRNFNPLLCQKLEKEGIKCHLPQRDTNQNSTEIDKYKQNIDGIKNSKKILAIGANESINWGLEVGYAFGLRKNIILLTNEDLEIPTMSLGMYYKVIRVNNLDNVDDYLNKLIEIILK